ncbi:hypothetical protein PG984_005037 [Apiospora sp. TS-2023a]
MAPDKKTKIAYNGHGFRGQLIEGGSKHNNDSARSRWTETDPNNPWICPCGKNQKPLDSWSKFNSHLRRHHGLRGSSASIRKAGSVEIDPETNKVIKPDNEEDHEDDEDEELPFLPPPDHGPKGPERKDDDDEDGDDGFGPSGAAGGLISAAA